MVAFRPYSSFDTLEDITVENREICNLWRGGTVYGS